MVYKYYKEIVVVGKPHAIGTDICSDHRRTWIREHRLEYINKGHSLIGTAAFETLCYKICKTIADLLVEQPNGVFIEDFGYLFVFRSPFSYKKQDSISDYTHSLQFYPVVSKDEKDGLYGWSFNKTPYPPLWARIIEKVKENYHYKNYSYSLLPLLKDKVRKSKLTKERRIATYQKKKREANADSN